mgnify:CR=1 FL=1
MASHHRQASPSCDDDDADDDRRCCLGATTRTYPFVRYAKSRKIQKGEDVERATVDARWTSKSVIESRNRRRRHHHHHRNVVSRDESTADAKDDDSNARRATTVEFVFASLFDGHGGKECAQFCAEETLECLLKALDSLEAELNEEEKTRVVETNRVRGDGTLKNSKLIWTRLSFFLSLSLSLFHTLTHSLTYTHSLSLSRTHAEPGRRI